MHITVNTNLLVIALTMLLELLTLANDGGMIPSKWTPYVMLAIAFIPKALSLLAHYSNPNGTPASQPYQPGAPITNPAFKFPEDKQ